MVKLDTLIRRIRKMRIRFVVLSKGNKMYHDIGYNKAIEDIIKLINTYKKKDK